MPITATDPSSTSCELPPQQRATPVRLTHRRWSTFCGVCRRQPRAVRILVSPIAARYLLPQRRARPAAAMDRLQLANRAIPLQWCRGGHLPDAAPAQCSTDAVLEKSAAASAAVRERDPRDRGWRPGTGLNRASRWRHASGAGSAAPPMAAASSPAFVHSRRTVELSPGRKCTA